MKDDEEDLVAAQVCTSFFNEEGKTINFVEFLEAVALLAELVSETVQRAFCEHERISGQTHVS